MWARWQGEPGLEHLHLTQDMAGRVADGLVIGVLDNTPFRLHYRIVCDAGWQVREATVDLQGARATRVELRTDRAGHWTTPTGDALPALDGCLDVDIRATPFTNTLPIRRLALQPGASAELLVAYISVPDLDVRAVRQRYTCLDARPDGGTYRYESLTSGFTAELLLDADGLVIDYPDVWRRVWPA